MLLLGLVAGAVAAFAAEPPALTANAAVLIDPETRQVLYDHNGGRHAYPASLTKMMTALLVAEHGNLGREVTVSKRAAAVGETTMNLSAGEKITLEHLLLGVLLNSANDASVACAESVAGSLEAFVTLMNQRAVQLGMQGTHFTNPTGLHNDRHCSTARDLALLALQVMGRAELRPIVRMQSAVVPWPGRDYSRALRNRNQLLAAWSQCDGIKTGYTRQAGRCLAASAYRDGWRLICVVLDSKDAWADARSLLEYGFQSFYKVALIARDVTRATVGVRRGIVDQVEASAVEDVVAVLPRGERPPEPRLLGQWTEAPVRAGETVGELEVLMPDGGTRRVPVVALEDVPRSLWATILGEPWALAGLALAVALALGVLVHGAASEAARARWLRRSS